MGSPQRDVPGECATDTEAKRLPAWIDTEERRLAAWIGTPQRQRDAARGGRTLDTEDEAVNALYSMQHEDASVYELTGKRA